MEQVGDDPSAGHLVTLSPEVRQSPAVSGDMTDTSNRPVERRNIK